ncbi:MAG: glycosyltransferase family 4 protein [Rhodospirillaceae bacterium]|nr:glycosyltransferase family 4 protein [Rhodospirillaceae bacterium]
MPEVWFAIPGDPETLTGGYVYARRLMDALPGAGWTPRRLSWPGAFPYPSEEDLKAVRASLEALPPRATVLIDGLAYGALPTSVLDGLNVRIVALVHHPLARESGIASAEAAHFEKTERAALTFAQRVVVTSPATAQTLTQDFGVPQNKIHIALPGTERAARAQGAGDVPLILTVGTLTPRKGHDVLIAALAEVADLPWKSEIVGSRERDLATTALLRKLIEHHDLGRRVTLAGEMNGDALRGAYGRADIFALASRYEGYGMVFAEALAHGLPVAACAAGAVTETVPKDAGLLTPPDDVRAFAGTLRRMLNDCALRAKLADAAWRHGQALPQWSDTAHAVANALNLTLEAAA